MKILVTGKYQPKYNRNNVLLRGLEQLGVELIEFPYPKRNKAVKISIRELEKDCDFIFLPSFTHLDVPFVRKITHKPIIFDPLISRYLSKVFDYKAVWRYSPRALKNYWKDKRSFKHSDLILADTQAHKEYYIKQFGIVPSKIAVVHVGVHTGDFYPFGFEKPKSDNIIVGFYGSFIPLHGIEIIIKAAKLLENRKDIEFRIYGDGPGYSKIHSLFNELALDSGILKGWVDYQELNKKINEMDICLGIFGDSLKADLVIPNKIYHYAACQKPIVTADTTGIKEIFEQGKTVFLTKKDASSLAQCLENIIANPSERNYVSLNCFDLITRDYSEKKIAAEFLSAINGKI